MLRSLMPTSLYSFMMPTITSLPLDKSSALRCTGAYFCMLTCNSRRNSTVGMWPLAFLILSMRAMLASPALAGNFTGGLFGFTSSAVVSAA